MASGIAVERAATLRSVLARTARRLPIIEIAKPLAVGEGRGAPLSADPLAAETGTLETETGTGAAGTGTPDGITLAHGNAQMFQLKGMLGLACLGLREVEAEVGIEVGTGTGTGVGK
jgi:hypothetical protein